MKEKYYTKGSTLLLAMVVISTVLFAGIGVGTILSRQIRGMATVENEAIAFYVAESVVDEISQNGNSLEEWESFDWEGLDVQYKAEEKAMEEYLVTVKVSNDYYIFDIKSYQKEDKGEIGGIMAYFRPRPWKNWSFPGIAYRLFPSGQVIIGSADKIAMNESVNYPGWYYFEVDPKEDEGVEVLFYKEDNISGGHTGFYYIEKNEKIANMIKRNGGNVVDLRKPISVYFNTDGDWNEVSIAYRESGNANNVIISSSHNAKMYDVSEEFGENWYVFHISQENLLALDVLFFKSGSISDNTGFYYIDIDWDIVSIRKGDSSVRQGYPNEIE